MTHRARTMSVKQALDLDWRDARLECLREAVVVLELGLKGPDCDGLRTDIMEQLVDLRAGLRSREKALLG